MERWLRENTHQDRVRPSLDRDVQEGVHTRMIEDVCDRWEVF